MQIYKEYETFYKELKSENLTTLSIWCEKRIPFLYMYVIFFLFHTQMYSTLACITFILQTDM